MSTIGQIVADQVDSDMIAKVMAKVPLSKMDDDEPVTKRSTTPAAVMFLEYYCHFLRYDPQTGTLRTPLEVSKMIHLDNFSDEAEKSTTPEKLQGVISETLHYALDIVKNGVFSTIYNIAFGLSKAIDAARYISSRALKPLLPLLPWKLLSSETHEFQNIQTTLIYDPGNVSTPVYSATLEGMLVATMLYPQIPYQIYLGPVAMMAKHDAIIELDHIKDHGDKYCMEMPADRFTGQYLKGDKVLFSVQRYVFFDKPEFLQGLLSLVATLKDVDLQAVIESLKIAENVAVDVREREWHPATVDWRAIPSTF
jgi:hypothetical protein